MPHNFNSRSASYVLPRHPAFYHRPVTLGWNFFSLLTIARLPFSLPPLPFQFSGDGTATGQNQYIGVRSKALKVEQYVGMVVYKAANVEYISFPAS